MTLAMLAPHDSDDVRMADLIDRMAAEFLDLSSVAEALQGLPQRFEHFESGEVELLQGMDLLSQRLQGLASFAQALATLVPRDWQLDVAPAAAVITLSDLQNRMAGSCRLPGIPQRSPEDNELDLF
jgi:hypothetical protein